MKQYKSYVVWALLVAIPVILYVYFLNVRAYTIYGDDLYIYDKLAHVRSFSDVIALTTIYGKLRPISTILTELTFLAFKRQLVWYYVFNVFVQVVNTYIFARILNLFFKSSIISLLFSLIYGLSRFSFFNYSQVFNGGVLEGIAMTFFLLSLFFILRTLVKDNQAQQQQMQSFLWSLFFANLCIYTHERYIVLFPFIILILLLFPGVKTLNRKYKTLLISIATLSVLFNIVIKKYGYSMPFFVGTGGTNISFSFSDALTFFTQAILCIFQINVGNLSHTGTQITTFPLSKIILIGMFAVGILLLFLGYLLRVKKAISQNEKHEKNTFFIFLSLLVLFLFCLAPAVVTIRLEQRWIQASFSVFLIMIAIALMGLPYKNERIRNTTFIVFMLGFLVINNRYYRKGVSNLYISDAQSTATVFKNAINDGVIYPEADTLYIWEKKTNIDGDGYITWDIGNGYLFEFYQFKTKKLLFIDSAYTATKPIVLIPGASAKTAEIVYVKNGVVSNITDEYIKDSLRHFSY